MRRRRCQLHNFDAARCQVVTTPAAVARITLEALQVSSILTHQLVA
jgi:hypothetical protein